MNLSNLIGQITILLNMWGENANPDVFVEMPDGTLLPITCTACKAGDGQELRMVFKVSGASP